MPPPTEGASDWERLLSTAARLQRIVPEAVLVGGTAAALHVAHRLSGDDLEDTDLSEYRDLAPRWQDWGNVQRTCIRIAVAAFDAASGGAGFDAPP